MWLLKEKHCRFENKEMRSNTHAPLNESDGVFCNVVCRFIKHVANNVIFECVDYINDYHIHVIVVVAVAFFVCTYNSPSLTPFHANNTTTSHKDSKERESKKKPETLACIQTLYNFPDMLSVAW